MRSGSWWEVTVWAGRLRVDLAEIMDELEPGWADWPGKSREPVAAS